MHTLQSNQAPIYARNGKPYLQTVPRSSGGIEVKPTAQLGQSLNSFWPVWLRQLTLEKMSQRYSVTVELFDRDRKRVAVTASGMSDDGLTYAVAGIAADIQPVLNPPLVRSKQPPDSFGEVQTAEWAIKPTHLDAEWDVVLASFKSPRVRLAHDLRYPPSWYKRRGGIIRMTHRPRRGSSAQPRLWQVAASLELHCALTVRR